MRWPEQVSYFRTALRASPVILVVSLITLVADSAGWLRRFEMPALDAFLASAVPRTSDIFIVEIRDDDYRDVFGARSPLDGQKLTQLLRGVLRASPAVVVVDLDTSHLLPREVKVLPDSDPVVWARDAQVDESGMVTVDPGLGATANGWGVALVPRDGDGLVRRYQRAFRLAGGDEDSSWAPSLATAAVARYCSDRQPDERCNGGAEHPDPHSSIRLLSFAGTRMRFPRLQASTVLASSEQAWWTASSPLRDRIVCIGGTFRQARDEYVTPLGPMYGVELVAQGIESELDGAVRQAGHGLMVFLEVMLGFLLVYVNWRFQPGTALSLWVNGLSVVTLALFASFIAFAAFSYWATFLPVALAVRLHVGYERRHTRKHEQRDLDGHRDKLAVSDTRSGPSAQASGEEGSCEENNEAVDPRERVARQRQAP